MVERDAEKIENREHDVCEDETNNLSLFARNCVSMEMFEQQRQGKRKGDGCAGTSSNQHNVLEAKASGNCHSIVIVAADIRTGWMAVMVPHFQRCFMNGMERKETWKSD